MAKLTKNVAVDGVWYGPDWGDQDVPDEVAAKIEREDVWAGYVPRGRGPSAAAPGCATADQGDGRLQDPRRPRG